MPQYFGEANQKEIRQYAEIIAMTDDVYTIANYLEISEQIIRQVKEHIFIKEHELDIPNDETNTISHVRGNFTPDGEIADLWISAKNGELQPRELSKFKRLIAHEYIEQALMADGLPYRSPKAWIEHPMYGFGNWPTPKNFGAHDIAPHTSKPNPFSHWVNIIGKSAEGLMLADNLSNLDELLEAIRERI
ncbi:hypothetical protein [Microcoleus sp. K5-D4]|uniref:hypothetical protein n=1 Tax=Microcoleus sp. K5-D4 TaxID=2818801 RepID=UPI002FCF0E79